MSFSFMPSRFGQIPGEDGGFSDPFATTGTIPGTTAAAQGGGSLSRGGRTYTGTLAQSKPKADRAADIKAKRQQISKAADNRAKMGIKTLVAALSDGVFASKKVQEKAVRVTEEKAALAADIAAVGQYNKTAQEAAKAKRKPEVERREGEYRGAVTVGFIDLIKLSYGTLQNPTPWTSFSSPAGWPPFPLMFALRNAIYDAALKARSEPAARDLFKRAADEGEDRVGAVVRGGAGSDTTDLKALPLAVYEQLLDQAFRGRDFPGLGWSAPVVSEKFPTVANEFGSVVKRSLSFKGSVPSKADIEQIFQRIAGNAAADRMGVSDLEVQRLRKELQILESTAGVDTSSLYEGGKSTSGSYTAEQRKSAEKARREAENKRREAVRARDVAAKAEAARRAAQARADTAEATRLEQEKRAAEERARAAEAQAADAERRAAEATASAVTGGTTAPSATGETAVVVTDSTGTPAVVVADEAVVPVVPTAPAKMNVGLLVVAAAAIGGGIWWFKNRRA